MRGRRYRRARGFTLVELIMVMMIVGMISSMAIPRLSQGATTASTASLMGDLTIVRKALLLYAAEHANTFPGPTAAEMKSQLTSFSDSAGNTASARSAVYQFGPYLAAIPELPLGPKAGSADVWVDTVNSPPAPQPAKAVGWVYNPNTGEFYANIGNVAVIPDSELGVGKSLTLELGLN